MRFGACGFPNLITIGNGQFKATSPNLTLNCGKKRGKYQTCLKLDIQIILNCLAINNWAISTSLLRVLAPRDLSNPHP